MFPFVLTTPLCWPRSHVRLSVIVDIRVGWLSVWFWYGPYTNTLISTMFGRTSGLTDMYSNALAFINTFHFIVPSMFCNLWLLVYSSNQKQETTCIFRINIQKHFCLFIYYKDRDFINMMFGTDCQLSIGFLFYLDFYILWSSFFFWNLCFVMLFNININSIIVLPFFEIFFVFDKIVC